MEDETGKEKGRIRCAECGSRICVEGKDCTGLKASIEEEYRKPDIRKIFETASEIEGTFYMQYCRLEELIEFSRRMGYRRLGIAFCVGLTREAEILNGILSRFFEVSSACCKVCGIDKKSHDLVQIRTDRFESTCNPVGQAACLNRDGTQLNIILGLCIGHDMLFTRYSRAPVTTFVVKDRVLAHNPAGALYSGYYQKNKCQMPDRTEEP
jgi:uncharacterized metal-binding protein